MILTKIQEKWEKKPLDYAKESVQNKWMGEEVQRIGYPTRAKPGERKGERERKEIQQKGYPS